MCCRHQQQPAEPLLPTPFPERPWQRVSSDLFEWKKSKGEGGRRKATTFLQDEYLKEMLAVSDESYFYFKAQCHHSFRKNDPPRNLKVAWCIVSGKVKHAYCTCVAGAVGFCNHVLAFLIKVCKFTLYECKSVSD